MNMLSSITRLAALAALSALGLAVANPVAAQQSGTVQQVIDLEPGWNAVYLYVEPDERDIRKVFAGLPIASVWRWLPDQPGAEFIEDPSEGLENIEGWFAWFPEPRPEAFLSNLFRIDPNTAYLIEVEGSTTQQITIEGRPRHRRQRWETDAFTLTGLAVNPDAPPTFQEFFESSPAHAGQPVYQLSASGKWHAIDKSSTPVKNGQAYWIHTRGASRYQGKMALVLEHGDSLEFSAALTESRLVLRNRSG